MEVKNLTESEKYCITSIQFSVQFFFFFFACDLPTLWFKCGLKEFFCLLEYMLNHTIYVHDFKSLLFFNFIIKSNKALKLNLHV